MANDLTSKFIPPDAEQRSPIIHHQKPPWINTSSVTIYPTLAGIDNKSEDPIKVRSAAIAAIEKWDSNLTIFTDGSSV